MVKIIIKQLKIERKIIDAEAIRNFLNLQRYYQVMNEGVKLLNGKSLEEVTNEELNKILHKKDWLNERAL